MTGQKQPRGFSIFFLTEMWERYGFYVLQTLLVFYALEKIHLNDAKAYLMVGSFTALAYVNSIFGGLIADRLIGYNKAILWGAVLLCGGYLILTVAQEVNIFILGLAIVTVGTGMLKPNISSMLSTLYRNNPKQKEIGYTLYYVGIYFGAIGGSFIGGYIKTYFGWSSVFISAVFGLAIAFFTFYHGQKKFALTDERKIRGGGKKSLSAIIAIGFLVVTAFFGIQNEKMSALLFSVIALASLIFLLHNIKLHHNAERKKLIAFSILTIFSGLYWAVYFQQFFSVSLCTARVTHLTVPESSLTAFESLGVIIFGPLINGLWLWLQKRNRDISITTKFSLSFLFNSLSFLVLILSLQYAMQHGIRQNQIFIIICYLLIAIGELFISPIGLAMVSTLVPSRLNGAMMGIFLMSIGLGGKLAGFLAQTSVSNTNATLVELEQTYIHSFSIYSIFSIIIFVCSILAIYPINKLIQERP